MSELARVVQKRVRNALGIELAEEDARAIGEAAVRAAVDIDVMLRVVRDYTDRPDVARIVADLEAMAAE